MVSGDVCSPCQPLKPHLRPDAAAAKMPGLRAGWSGEGLALLLRDQNEGMDFAAHNVRPVSIDSNALAHPSSQGLPQAQIQPWLQRRLLFIESLT